MKYFLKLSIFKININQFHFKYIYYFFKKNLKVFLDLKKIKIFLTN